MLRILALLIAAGLAVPVAAETVHVTWENAPKNTDGTSIPATGPGSLTKTIVEYGTCAADGTSFGAKAGEITVAAPGTMLDVNLVVVQMYCLHAKHENTYGVQSAYSNVAVTEVEPPTPGAPESLAVTVADTTAYRMRQSVDGLAFLPIGTVEPGTECDGSHSIDGYRIVPRDAVKLASRFDTLPLVVLAKCS